jgi:hypothetical protein
MIANTCNTQIVTTLNNALASATGKLRSDINNAIVRINNCFLNQTDITKIKSFVKETMQQLKIFRDYKTKISNLLDKLK